MRTIRRAGPLAAVAVVVALTACVPFKSQAPVQPLARDLYVQVNNTRAAHGLGPLAWNDQLAGVAQEWSEHIATTGNFSHQNLQALLARPEFAGFSGLAENIMRGRCGMSASEIHQSIMNSALHRANILGSYSDIGIGAACHDDTLAVVEDFAR